MPIRLTACFSEEIFCSSPTIGELTNLRTRADSAGSRLNTSATSLGELSSSRANSNTRRATPGGLGKRLAALNESNTSVVTPTLQNYVVTAGSGDAKTPVGSVHTNSESRRTPVVNGMLPDKARASVMAVTRRCC